MMKMMKKTALFTALLIGLIAVSVRAQDAEITVEITPETLKPGGKGTITAHYRIPDHMYMALQENFFFIDAVDFPGMELLPIEYPDGEEKKGLIIYKDDVELRRDFILKDVIKPGTYSIELVTGYQFCDENGTCFLPQKETHTVTLSVSNEEGAERTAEESTAAAGADSSLFRILQFILFAFVGGIILNVMPCVLPLLSVRALSLVNQGGKDRKKIFAGSMAYTGGIILSFFILSGIVTMLKVSGELVGWGFQFQNPSFVIVLISVIFVFALSMFDVFVITPPGMNAAAKASGKGGYLGSFLTGVFAVLVATPCTAPFLGAALGFAFSQPPAIIFLIFFFVGLGLALPFIILGIWPRFIQKIPKPGNWMTVFKEAMGFLLIGTVVYLLTTLFRQVSGENFIRALVFLGVLAFASWLYGRFAKPGSPKLRQWIVLAAAAAIVTLGAVFILKTSAADPDGREAAEEVYINEEWEPFSPEKVAEYRAAGEPIFISFHAAWCTNCKINKAAVLSTEPVLEAFSAYGVRLLHADYTERNPVIAEWIEQFGKAGVPVYVLYVPNREQPVIFPELLSKQMIIRALENHLF